MVSHFIYASEKIADAATGAEQTWEFSVFFFFFFPGCWNWAWTRNTWCASLIGVDFSCFGPNLCSNQESTFKTNLFMLTSGSLVFITAWLQHAKHRVFPMQINWKMWDIHNELFQSLLAIDRTGQEIFQREVSWCMDSAGIGCWCQLCYSTKLLLLDYISY